MKRTKRRWPRFQVKVTASTRARPHFVKLYTTVESAELHAHAWCIDNWRAFTIEVIVKYGNKADVLLQRYTPADTPRVQR